MGSKFTLVAIVYIFVNFSLGCANKAKRVEFPEGTNPTTELGLLDADIQQAELNQIDITAPNYFAVAKRKLAEARKMESEGKPEKKILETVGEARGNLNYALTQQYEYSGELNDILEAREAALKAGALEHAPSAFQRVDWELKEAVKDYKPKKNYLSFSEHQAFRNKYLDLQVRSIAAGKKSDPTAAAIAELTFDPNQAEVTRNGDRILIRLIGNSFAPGQITITEETKSALDKVKDILARMEQEQVTIRGYTDSKGSAKVNQKISEDRAEAVAEYLLSSGVITQDQIEYEGFGSKEGAGATRRVDIIITPTKTE